MNTQSMLQVGTILHGTYRIESYLSSGGFGNTYVVRHVEFDEVFALKEFYIKGVCQRDADSASISVSNEENTQTFAQQREKFKKEARRIHRLNTAHIIRVHDSFEENGTAYYVMDLVDGESLKDRIRRTGRPLTEAEVNTILWQVLDGLRAIHTAGIWHLDIKPANIMVDKRGVVKLIDFGASKQQSNAGGATTSTGISYTPGYAPGEQMAQDYDEFGLWTDFYALGATLYNLITLQVPPSVTKVADDETADKHIALPMPNVSKHTRGLIAWMMQDKRKRRPQSADEILTRMAGDDDTIVVGVEPGEPSEGEPEPTTGINPPKKKRSLKLSTETLRIVLYVYVGTIIVACVVFFALLSRNAGEAQNASGEAQQEIQAVPQEFSYTTFTVNGVSFDMAKVEAGTFTMGATSEQQDPYDDEKPAHEVTLTNNYYLGKTEVTQGLWNAVMGSNPSHFQGDDRPVESVSWDDCRTFIEKLNAETGKQFRLPTEAEWEFAARGGNNSRHYQYSGSNAVLDVAWLYGNSGNQTHDVATKDPNELGIYDMSGNVWELCKDWHGGYGSSAQTNPRGSSNCYYRVARGGCWNLDAGFCRSSCRSGNDPNSRDYRLGLRLALSE